jgi:hypothetical protein
MRILWIALIVVFCGLPPLCHSQVAGRQAVEKDVAADALNKENLAWEFTKKKDKAGLAKLLSKDFTEITEDGVFERDQILANLDILTLTSYSPRDFKAKVIAPDTVLLIFQVTVSGTYKDHSFQTDNNADRKRIGRARSEPPEDAFAGPHARDRRGWPSRRPTCRREPLSCQANRQAGAT